MSKKHKASYEKVAATIDQIEAEMKRIGMWQNESLAPKKIIVTEAFGGNHMAISQWLQFIFIPNVRKIIADKGEFPQRSQVAARAYREWESDGCPLDTARLHHLLIHFDEMF